MERIECRELDGTRRDYIDYGPAIPPQERSDYIVEVKFDRYRYHCGEGDMWPQTWGKDGSLYTAAGDNKGSPMNFWRVSSYGSWSDGELDPGKLTNTNDWTIDLIDPLPIDPKRYCLNPDAPGVKPAGLLDVDGTLYFAVEAQNYGDCAEFNRQCNLHGWIVTSQDYGKSWDREATPTDFFTGRLASCHFLQFGRGYEGAMDGYVYAYFPCGEDGRSYWENGDGMLLGRVPREKILCREAWEFCAGLDAAGSPRWSPAEEDAQWVFSYPKMTGENHVCYNPGIGRFIMGNYSFVDNEVRPRPIHQMRWPQAYRSQLTLFEAERPWGPWKLFYRDDNWGTYGDYQPSFPTKWMFADGHLMLMVSSGSWDDYNFVVQKMAVRLKGEEGFCPQSRYFGFR